MRMLTRFKKHLLLVFCISSFFAIPTAIAQNYEDVVVGSMLSKVTWGSFETPLSKNICGPLSAYVAAYPALSKAQAIRDWGGGPYFTAAQVRGNCQPYPATPTEIWFRSAYLDPLTQATSAETDWYFGSSPGISVGCIEGRPDYDKNVCVKRIYHDNSCTTKNPVSPGTGEKFYYETDYTGAGAHPLEFTRLYRSNFRGLPKIANGWTNNWQRSIDVVNTQSVADSTANVQKPDGKHIAFKYNGSTWIAQTNGQFDTLTEIKTNSTRTGWKLNVWTDDSSEFYDATGSLLKIVQRNGWTSTITYSTATTDAAIAPFAGLPITITNHFGRKLQLRYNSAGQLIKLIDPAGGVIQYGYDASFNLTKITWQDNTVRQYLYATPDNGRLTGVIDEGGVRIGTFTYDNQGRVLSSEKSNGAEKLTFSYGVYSTTINDITNAKTITHNFGTAQGVIRPTNISGSSPLCGNTAAATTYDAKGNITQRTEHDGTVTQFTYDTKNRETKRIEAAGTAAAKTYTAQWHATWNLPTLRTEPFKITAYTYDAKGNLTGQADTPTTDASGAAGVNAARDVAKPILADEWVFDVNNLSLTFINKSTASGLDPLTIKHYRYSYDQFGNEIAARNELNSKSRSVAFNTDGLPIRGQLNTGITFSYQYNINGFLVKEKWGSEVTNIIWNKNARPERIQNPDGSYILYKYNTSGRYESETYYLGNGVPTVLIDILDMLVGTAWAIPSDQWWGYTNPAFRDWAHKEFFNGTPSPTTKADMDQLWKIWNEEGCPRGKGGKSGKGGKGGSSRGGGRNGVGGLFRGGGRGIE